MGKLKAVLLFSCGLCCFAVLLDPGLNTFKPRFKPHAVLISLLVSFFSLDGRQGTHPSHQGPPDNLQTWMCSADTAVFMPVYLQGGTRGVAGYGASSRVGAARSCHTKQVTSILG